MSEHRPTSTKRWIAEQPRSWGSGTGAFAFLEAPSAVADGVICSDAVNAAARRSASQKVHWTVLREAMRIPNGPRRTGFHPRSARRNTIAGCSARRWAPSAICVRQLVPAATITASGAAARTAGKSANSPTRIEVSKCSFS